MQAIISIYLYDILVSLTNMLRDSKSRVEFLNWR